MKLDTLKRAVRTITRLALLMWVVGQPVSASQWITNRKDSPPFSFIYNGQPSAELLKTWTVRQKSSAIDQGTITHEVVYTDQKTGLVVRWVSTEYQDFPTIEWTLYFENTGKSSTSIIEKIQSLDFSLDKKKIGDFVLYHNKGSFAAKDDFQPLETKLTLNTDLQLSSTGGRPTNKDFPYFNLAWPQEGLIVAIGWPGQWEARFTRNEVNRLHVNAGQELTHFKLNPGETVRSPRIVLQFWKGERLQAQNTWRRWMITHNMPRPGGKLPQAQFVACSSHQFNEMLNANEGNQKLFIERYLREGLKIDYWWMDAGWYVNDGTWINTGTWEVDRKRFPNGLRAVTDHARDKGVKSIVWFEPERVTKGSWLYENHPEWLLKPPQKRDNQQYNPEWRLLNLGNREARQWLIEHVDAMIKEEGIDLYRQDFNLDPLYFWRANDADDRQGITEINYVTGYLEYWDELMRRHPNLLIDSCASGGRRNDIETLRRAVPLLRSDYLFEPVGQQAHTYGLSSWIPFHGTGTLIGSSAISKGSSSQVDPYVFRSNMASNVTACWDVRREDLDYAKLRSLVDELRHVSPLYLGDYYPLTSYSLGEDVWMVWQFNRRDEGRGVVQAFRRTGSTETKAMFKLRGLEPKISYLVTNVDSPQGIKRTGQQLMREGLLVEISDRPGAVTFMYQKIKRTRNS